LRNIYNIRENKWKSGYSVGFRRSCKNLYIISNINIQKNIAIFTHHHQHGGLNQYIGTVLKKSWEFPEVVKQLEENKHNCEEILNILQKNVPQVGTFFAQQITNDMREAGVLTFESNNYCWPGPGAKRGIKIIFDATNYLSKMKWLQKNQRSEFERLKLDFPFHPVYGELSLSNIEHSLCEFSKYQKLLAKKVHLRQYNPHKK